MTNLTPTLLLAKELIERQSVTPDTSDCQLLLAKRLAAIGFSIQHLPFENTPNLWATIGNSGPLFVFAGHTDVVPPGDETKWTSPPFKPEIRDGFLYGRGAADMKSSIACMIIACEQFLSTNKLTDGRIGFLITGDEEGTATHGTKAVMEYLVKQGEQIDYALVGEATCENQFGDTIKIGRRGSLSASLNIHGKQGHIAYPEKACNPIHQALPALSELSQLKFDQGSDYFSPTSLQISNIHAGTGANNVIPQDLSLQFNFRFSPTSSVESLKEKTEHVLQSHGLNYSIEWVCSGLPFLTESKKLVRTLSQLIEKYCGLSPDLSTSGGTSDARFIAPTGAEVLEFGPINQTIHQIDESVSINDLEILTKTYHGLLIEILIAKKSN